MLQIIVNHNPNKKGCKVLQHFEENWKYEIRKEEDDDGNEIEVGYGIHPKAFNIPVKKVVSTSGESIMIVDTIDIQTPLFTLQGSKALQLNILQSQLLGLIKVYK